MASLCAAAHRRCLHLRALPRRCSGAQSNCVGVRCGRRQCCACGARSVIRRRATACATRACSYAAARCWPPLARVLGGEDHAGSTANSMPSGAVLRWCRAAPSVVPSRLTWHRRAGGRLLLEGSAGGACAQRAVLGCGAAGVAPSGRVQRRVRQQYHFGGVRLGCLLFRAPREQHVVWRSGAQYADASSVYADASSRLERRCSEPRERSLGSSSEPSGCWTFGQLRHLPPAPQPRCRQALLRLLKVRAPPRRMRAFPAPGARARIALVVVGCGHCL